MIQIPQEMHPTEFERLKAEVIAEWGATLRRKAKRRRKLRRFKGVTRAALVLLLAALTGVLFVGLATNGRWSTAIRLLQPWGMFAAYRWSYARARRRGQGGVG